MHVIGAGHQRPAPATFTPTAHRDHRAASATDGPVRRSGRVGRAIHEARSERGAQ